MIKNYNWNSFLKEEKKKNYFKKLIDSLNREYKKFNCYPNNNQILSSLKYCSFQNLKVVLLGQDPYFKKNQADGLCFSVPNGMIIPPSLKNIFIEINNCFHCRSKKNIPTNGSLIRWAIQGVLLLNSILTVRSGSPISHKGIGWEIFTNHLIENISTKKKNIVFLLWGKYAKKKESYINSLNKHLILKTSHPSPFSSHLGFFGSKHFLKTNEFLNKNGKSEILW